MAFSIVNIIENNIVTLETQSNLTFYINCYTAFTLALWKEAIILDPWEHIKCRRQQVMIVVPSPSKKTDNCKK